MSKKTQKRVTAQGEYTDWITPRRGCLNISIRQLESSTITLQRRVPATRGSITPTPEQLAAEDYIPPGNVKNYTADVETCLPFLDFSVGTEYRLGVLPGNYGSDAPLLILWK